MLDPFAAIDDGCGEVTDSQKRLLLNAPFIDVTNCSGDPILLSGGGAARAFPAAGEPIFICTAPDTPSFELGPDLGFPDPSEETRVSERRSTTDPPSEKSTGFCEPSEPDLDQVSKDEIEKYRYRAIQILRAICGQKAAASGEVRRTQVLPEENKSGTTGDPQFLANLEDVINLFSGKPNKEYAEIDILELAAKKGLDFHRSEFDMDIEWDSITEQPNATRDEINPETEGDNPTKRPKHAARDKFDIDIERDNPIKSLNVARDEDDPI